MKIAIIGSDGKWARQVEKVFALLPDVEVSVRIDVNNQDKIDDLKNCDVVYISLPPESQQKYLDFCVENSIDLICESPFLIDDNQRSSVLAKRMVAGRRGLVYVNYPFLVDSDIIMAISALSRSKTFSLKIETPTIESKEKTKKIAANSMIAAIINSLTPKHKSYESIHYIDDMSFCFNFKDISVDCSIVINDEAKHMTLSVLTEDKQVAVKVCNSVLKQLFPTLTIIPMIKNAKLAEEIDVNFYNSFIIERFSDLFVGLNGKDCLMDKSKIVANGNN
jgi:hypothetical protein